MQRSTDRILTTHAGSLPRTDALEEAFDHRLDDPDGFIKLLPDGVAQVLRQQRDAGVDVVNDGEVSKSTWVWYAIDRLTGLENRPASVMDVLGGADMRAFPDFYNAAVQAAALWYGKEDAVVAQEYAKAPTAVEAIGYNPEPIRRDIENLKAALPGVDGVTEAFLPVAAPASIEVGTRNEFYTSQDEFVWGLAEAMRQEYREIVDAGFLLQIDDAWTPAYWDQQLPRGIDLDEFRAYCQVRVDALNHALEGIPKEKVRYHMCWGSWHGPHSTDIPLRDMLPTMLQINAGAFLLEASNPRHEHEYHVWEDNELPDGAVIIPGVVSHCTNLLEHPELVAERITRFAERVGKENVIAGTDCGLGGRVHPELVWAKLGVLAEGAKLASDRLWKS